MKTFNLLLMDVCLYHDNVNCDYTVGVPQMPPPCAPKRDITPGLLGSAAVFLSAFFYYMSTVVICWSQARVVIDPAYFAIFRFFRVCGGLLGYGSKAPGAKT